MLGTVTRIIRESGNLLKMLLNLISIVLFKSWQPYMNIFMHTARHNPEVRFTLVTNLDENHQSWAEVFGNLTKPHNVVLAHYTFDMVVTEIQKNNLGLGPEPLSVMSPYKLIDFKPMYGTIFRKELVGFSHWGWFDMDVHFGDIKRSFECDYDNEDFISYDKTRVNGPMMVSRNTEFVTTFYKNVLSYPKSLKLLRGVPAILFDEKHMNYMIRNNQSATLKRSHLRNCDVCDIWMWYKGQMQNTYDTCVISHFGGGGSALSSGIKENEWAHMKAYFEGGYHNSDEYGYGTFRRVNFAPFSFVFTFNSTKDFVIVSTTVLRPGVDIERYLRKLAKLFKVVSSRFLLPNSVCSPRHVSSNSSSLPPRLLSSSPSSSSAPPLSVISSAVRNDHTASI